MVSPLTAIQPYADRFNAAAEAAGLSVRLTLELTDTWINHAGHLSHWITVAVSADGFAPQLYGATAETVADLITALTGILMLVDFEVTALNH